MMEKRTVHIDVDVYPNLDEMSSADAMLVKMAREATRTAYAPYSKFEVGAAVLLGNGAVVMGSNQENIAYPSGLCAERTALFAAGAQHAGVPVRAIAIAAQTGGAFCKHAIYPCGACRQVMMETQLQAKHPIKVIMAGAERIEVVHSVADLLPLSFEF